MKTARKIINKPRSENKKNNATFSENQLFMVFFPLLIYLVCFIAVDMIVGYAMYGQGGTFSAVFDNLSAKMLILLSAFVFVFPKIPQIVIFNILSLFLILYGYAQVCFRYAKSSLLRFSTIFATKEGADYAVGAIKNVPVRITVLFILLIVLVVGADFLLVKFLRKPPKKIFIAKTAVCFVLMGISVAFIPFVNSEYDVINDDNAENKTSYTNFSICNFTDPVTVMSRSDYFDYCLRDLWSMNYVKSHLEENIKTVNDFMESKPEHKDNEMTGIFKDKNLIIVQMESLDYSALTEEICPNLWKIREESIDFPNFYTPRFGDTLTFGTETAVNTGLYSTAGFVESEKFVDYSFPYSLCNLFGEKGYVSNEYHFNDPEFYNRGKIAPVYGFKGYNRLKDLIADKSYNTEFDDAICKDGVYQSLISEDRFIDYIVTYSPHPFFATTEERYKVPAQRHPELAEKLGSSTESVFKMMCTITDDMAGELIEKLDKDGKLDDTVIVFMTDHLSNTTGVVSDYKDSDQRMNNTPFFIYAKGIKPVTIEKVCKSSDVLPTLLNMFGFEIPKKYIGEDIFDENYEGFAYFPDMSWITNKGYFKNGGVVEKYTDEEITSDYIKKNTLLARKYIDINNTMIYTDYYSKEK